MKALLLLGLIVPTVMILVSKWLERHPAPYPGKYRCEKWKCGASGYNSPSSRKSERHWQYAQRIAPERFFYRGKQCLLICAVCVLVGVFVLWEVALIAAYIAGFAYLLTAFFETERELRAL